MSHNMKCRTAALTSEHSCTSVQPHAASSDAWYVLNPPVSQHSLFPSVGPDKGSYHLLPYLGVLGACDLVVNFNHGPLLISEYWKHPTKTILEMLDPF